MANFLIFVGVTLVHILGLSIGGALGGAIAGVSVGLMGITIMGIEYPVGTIISGVVGGAYGGAIASKPNDIVDNAFLGSSLGFVASLFFAWLASFGRK